MIAADTSVWIDFFRGVESETVKLLEKALSEGNLTIPGPVLFEILSGPGLTEEGQGLIVQLPRLDFAEGIWDRAGIMRRKLVERKSKARGMDCLIAQNCIENEVALITSDVDFRHFLAFGLTIVSTSEIGN